MSYQSFIIMLAMSLFTSSPIITTRERRMATATGSITDIPETTETLPSMTETIIALSRATEAITALSSDTETGTVSSSTVEINTALSRTTKIPASSSTIITTTSLTISNNRSCITQDGSPGWLCDDQTSCIWLRYVCDRIPPPDCPDGSDEAAGCSEDLRYCPFKNETGRPGWRCDSGECIYKGKTCNSIPDCKDGSDERAGCTAMDLVPCPTDNSTLTERWIANLDCRVCWDINNWRCDNGECIHKIGVCNSILNCKDGSDETSGCADMDLVPCPNNNSTLTERWAANVDCRMCKDVNNWRCDNGHCTKKVWVCDGRPGNCLDGSDEWEGCTSSYVDRFSSNKTGRSCLTKYGMTGWLCDDQTTCIWLRFVCDGVSFIKFNCPDGSDEVAGCKEDLRYCPFEMGKPGWRCDSGECISKGNYCDSFKDCEDGSDEISGCAAMDLIACPTNNSTLTERWAANVDCRDCWDSDNWRCDNGQCTKKWWVCDGRPDDCLDGSDEWEGCKSEYTDRFPLQRNSRSCLTKYGRTGWLCDDQTFCIWLPNVCDGNPHPDCPDGSDETSGCGEDPRYCQYETGSPGWRCDSGECIEQAIVCDNFPQCKDGSDERAGCKEMDLVPCSTNNSILTERWAAYGYCRSCRNGGNFWRCDNGRCIKKYNVCDGRSDCLDASDEWVGCDLVTCTNDSTITTAKTFADGDCRRCWDEDSWRCNDGRCISKEQLCDGTGDCSSDEDETIICSSLVPCFDNGVRVLTEQKFQQSGHCRSCYDSDHWRCNSGQCIRGLEVCNNVMFGRWDCNDGSDEEPGSGCPANITCIADKSIVTTPHFSNGTSLTCLSCSSDSKEKIASNYKRCKNGQCKHKVLFCNGYPDCFDGSDEFDCNIFAYFDTTKAVMLSFGLVALTSYLYIKFTNFHSFILTSAPKKYPKKMPKVYKNIRKYCNMLESDNEKNEDKLKKLHNSIRKKRNGLRELIVTITSLYEEPQLCHKYCNKILNEEIEFHENRSQSLMYIRMTAGSNEYTEKFANAIEPPGCISKLSFSFKNRLEYISLKIGHLMRLIKALTKMALFYLDVIKDVALFFKLWHIVSELEDVNILQHVLVYVSGTFIFLAQSIIGMYFAVQLGKPHKKLPPSLLSLVIFLLFLISPLIPVILVVKESLLNSDIEEKNVK